MGKLYLSSQLVVTIAKVVEELGLEDKVTKQGEEVDVEQLADVYVG